MIDKSNNYVVIMAGGIGSRFWPFSRNNRPKQFHDILNTGRSLIQMTFDRFAKHVPHDHIYVVTHESYHKLVREHLPELGEDQILLEPLRRNTAPCIAYASYKIAAKNKNAIITVAPSDHVILDTEAFNATWGVALDAAASDHKLITLGIKPKRPETGFGYIQFLESEEEIKKVKTFTEKPELELAQKFIDSGDFLWNSGIFIWSAESILAAFEVHQQEMAEIFKDIKPALYTAKEKGAIEEAYAQCNNISIDYAIMEKASNVYVVPGDFGWSDLGSWEALYTMSEKNDLGNVVEANAMMYDTENTLVRGPKNKLIIVQGLEGYLVTECDNVLLICKRDDEQQFRDFVADVKDSKGKEFL